MPLEPKTESSARAAWTPRFVWLLLPSFLAALPVLLAIFGGPEVKQTRWDAWGVGVWFLLLVVAEALPVPMARGGTMTIASILDLGAILLFGPWIAGTLDLVTTVIAQMLILRRPSSEAVLNAGRMPDHHPAGAAFSRREDVCARRMFCATPFRCSSRARFTSCSTPAR
jgi:hypothetical protein